MSRREHQLVKVHWSGPLSVNEAVAGEFAQKKGLYQIYGRHVVFGADALLYVGMTEDQSFSARFAQHERWLGFESDVTVRLGIIKEEPPGVECLAERRGADDLVALAPVQLEEHLEILGCTAARSELGSTWQSRRRVHEPLG